MYDNGLQPDPEQAPPPKDRDVDDLIFRDELTWLASDR